MRDEKFQFICMVFLDRFFSECWAKTKTGFFSSSKQPNLQLVKKDFVAAYKIVENIIYYSFDIMISIKLKDTLRYTFIFHRDYKSSISQS